MRNLIDIIVEDSLDDFDNNGKLAKKRAEVSAAYKNKVDEKISKCIDRLYELCSKFFNNKGIDVQKSDGEHLGTNKFKIFFPDLGWSFTYNPNDSIQFDIAIGEYGRIDKTKDANECERLLKELSEYIQYDMKNFEKHVSIWKDSAIGLTSASWRLQMSMLLKNIK